MQTNQIPAICKEVIINVSFSKKKTSSLLTNITYKKQFSPLNWQIQLHDHAIEFQGKPLKKPFILPYEQLRKVEISAYGRPSPSLGITAASCNYFIQLALYLQDETSIAFETLEYSSLKDILKKLKDYKISVYDKYQWMDMLCTKANEDITAFFEKQFDTAAKTYGLTAFKNDYQRK